MHLQSGTNPEAAPRASAHVARDAPVPARALHVHIIGPLRQGAPACQARHTQKRPGAHGWVLVSGCVLTARRHVVAAVPARLVCCPPLRRCPSVSISWPDVGSQGIKKSTHELVQFLKKNIDFFKKKIEYGNMGIWEGLLVYGSSGCPYDACWNSTLQCRHSHAVCRFLREKLNETHRRCGGTVNGLFGRESHHPITRKSQRKCLITTQKKRAKSKRVCSPHLSNVLDLHKQPSRVCYFAPLYYSFALPPPPPPPPPLIPHTNSHILI